ncbi:type II toxin-antitoxin system Phd/YefM family antitoxin [[Mycobacterium] vasticus]|uniref:Antitoxin n=1 Tax=[Mycobacterium] vasticus TaxID=2875777 RepID=A0ABU5YZQ8_9MYCO|nr:type II toxin-antitoxin system Phd/YefM family antitoxin [Mycolicibacter sp. MYC017]MEB3070615.1 type II toxin-antitoxin system Phd/YefM family antitoxin [Mycolicibacter sp. MYC017]
MSSESVNVYDAKTRLSSLLSQVEGGAEIVISRNGRPIARLVPYQPDRVPRRPGLWKGRVTIAADFDQFGDADDRDWYGA